VVLTSSELSFFNGDTISTLLLLTKSSDEEITIVSALLALKPLSESESVDNDGDPFDCDGCFEHVSCSWNWNNSLISQHFIYKSKYIRISQLLQVTYVRVL
jgi:hypothetical protein